MNEPQTFTCMHTSIYVHTYTCTHMYANMAHMHLTHTGKINTNNLELEA